MHKVKVFKNYAEFRGAIAKLVPKKKQPSISYTLVQLGYAERKDEGMAVVYSLKEGVKPTSDDVEKVVQAMNCKR